MTAGNYKCKYQREALFVHLITDFVQEDTEKKWKSANYLQSSVNS